MDLIAFVYSLLLIATCMAISACVSRMGKSKGKEYSELARKIVHIGVSNWFFIYYFCFENNLYPLLGLVLFAIVNAFLNVTGLFHKLMGQESKKRNWGLVYYPISVALLIALYQAGLGDKVTIGCALLGMGYGDGGAALIGRKFGKHKIEITDKTMEGSAAMAVITFVVVFALKSLLGCSSSTFMLLIGSVGLGLIAAVVELFTPYGLDNITVPILIYLLGSAL